MRFRRGGKVVMRPGADADLHARMLDGRTATIERIFIDYDGKAHLGVTIDGDPGQELMRDTGRLLFFFAPEVEVVDDGMRRAWSVSRGSCRRRRQRLAARRRLRRRGRAAPAAARAAAGRRGDGRRHRRARPRLRGDARLRRARDPRRQPPGRRAGDAVRDGGRRGLGRGRDRGRRGDQPARHGPADGAALRQVDRRLARAGGRDRVRARRRRGDRLGALTRGAGRPSSAPSRSCSRRSRSCATAAAAARRREERRRARAVAERRDRQHRRQARRRAARERSSACASGSLRQVVPDTLEFYFEFVARGTVCEGARLEQEVVEARLRCERMRTRMGDRDPRVPLPDVRRRRGRVWPAATSSKSSRSRSRRTHASHKGDDRRGGARRQQHDRRAPTARTSTAPASRSSTS